MNLRPSGYEPDELPGCSIPRQSQICFHRVRENWAFSRFGGDLLSRGLSPSTIGAAVLNFRVRDGTGCFTCAMTTKPRKSPRSTFLLCKKATMREAASFVYKRRVPARLFNQPTSRLGAATLSFVKVGVCFGLVFPLLDQIKPIGRLVPVN